jgi:hypothetical protein
MNILDELDKSSAILKACVDGLLSNTIEPETVGYMLENQIMSFELIKSELETYVEDNEFS